MRDLFEKMYERWNNIGDVKMLQMLRNGDGYDDEHLNDCWEDVQTLVNERAQHTKNLEDTIISMDAELKELQKEITANKAEVPIEAIEFCISCAIDVGYESNASTAQEWLDSLPPLKDGAQ